MVFAKHLRELVRRGRITSSIRIWVRPHVKAGGRYRMDEGEILVESIVPLDLSDLTDEMARESGFEDVDALLAVARHGAGDNVYLIRFQYIPPGGWPRPAAVPPPGAVSPPGRGGRACRPGRSGRRSRP